MTACRTDLSIEQNPMTSMRRSIVAGVAVVGFLIFGFGFWGTVTELSGAVLANGVVVVESQVKKVQHPTGGVVSEILVKDGDRVKAGQIVMRLDETVTRSNLQMLTNQIDELKVRMARLEAERDNLGEILFPADLMTRRDEDILKKIMKDEESLFVSRQELREGQKKQLGERVLQLKDEVSGLGEQIEAKQREIALIDLELKGVEKLESKQLVTANRINSLRRENARLEGELGRLKSSAAQAKGRTTEIELQILSIDQGFKTDLMKELREVQAKQGELIEKKTAAEDQLKRVTIIAPQAGIVHQMTIHTVGGVVNPSEPIMLIIPENDNLIVQARVAPQDIDQVLAGDQTVFVRFSAFNHQTTPELIGQLRNVSADLSKDESTGDAFYVARIEIPDFELKKLSGKTLIPGMPAEVHIKTEERMALSYLVKPVQDQMRRAFRER